MPVTGSKTYCDAVNANKKIVDEDHAKIRDQKQAIKDVELEITKREKLIKQQKRNCSAVAWINPAIEDGTNISKVAGGRKSRKSKKSKKSRKSRRR